jgi:hypothetical protein
MAAIFIASMANSDLPRDVVAATAITGSLLSGLGHHSKNCAMMSQMGVPVGAAGNSGVTAAVLATFVESCRASTSTGAKARGATVLAHRLRFYLTLHERADALEGRARFRKTWR